MHAFKRRKSLNAEENLKTRRIFENVDCFVGFFYKYIYQIVIYLRF